VAKNPSVLEFVDWLGTVLKMRGVLIVMNHEGRKVVHFNITDPPPVAWTAQQIVNAF